MEKKRLLLRIDPALHDDLRWAEDEFRSINAQIEFYSNKPLPSESGTNGRWDAIIESAIRWD